MATSRGDLQVVPVDQFMDWDGEIDFSDRRLSHADWSEAEIQEWQRHMQAHGTLMILGWGFLIPVAASASLLLRHRNKHPRYPFIGAHAAAATTGTLLNVIAWVIALRNFDVLQHGPKVDENGRSLPWNGKNMAYAHAVLGMVVMIGACANVLLYGIMSKPQREDETFQDFPLRRKIGHMTHRVMGHILIVLALVTCGLGTRITHSDESNANFLKGLLVALSAALCVWLLFWRDKAKYRLGETAARGLSSERPSESSALLA